MVQECDRRRRPGGAALRARQVRGYPECRDKIRVAWDRQIAILERVARANLCAGVVRYELAQLYDPHADLGQIDVTVLMDAVRVLARCGLAGDDAAGKIPGQPDRLVAKVVASLEFAICNPECEMERPSEWIGNDPDFGRLFRTENKVFQAFLDNQRKRDYPGDGLLPTPVIRQSDRDIPAVLEAAAPCRST